MEVAATALSIVLALSFVGTGAMKLFGQAKIIELLGELGVQRRMAAVIGALELAAVAGLLAGLVVPWMGIAAAAGLVLLMIGATLAHHRAGDYNDTKRRAPALMPVFLAACSALTCGLQFATI